MLPHVEAHRLDRVGWLRAAVLGANDGIVSTASLVVGVAASGAAPAAVMVAGVAGLVAGAMSMAAGEYVSVSSQADTEGADIARETRELATDPEHELAELAEIYERRGLDASLARQVALQLTAHNALESHLRDELGITDHQRARPLQAAVASAGTFALGAAVPLIMAWVSPAASAAWIITIGSLLLLVTLGGLAAKVGGANAIIGAARVGFWGAFAMGLTYAAGKLFGAAG